MGIKTTSIIGLSKNAGKTTLFNYLIDKLVTDALKVGVASIGIDGEELDVWSSKPKPPVSIPKGCYVATTAQGLNYGTGQWRIVEQINLHSITGTVYIAEALEDGTAKLIGTHTLDDIKEVHRLFEKLDIQEFLIDGAYDRFASASPIISEQVYLVIGASLHEDERYFWNLVYEKIYPLFLQTLNNEQILLGIRANVGAGKALVYNKNKWLALSFEELILNEDSLAKQTEWLYLPGVLLENTLIKLLNKKLAFNIVLEDGLKCFASSGLIERWVQAGGTIQVINPINVRGIAINPYSPSGYSYSANKMKSKLTNLLQGFNKGRIPILNIWEDQFE